MSKKSGYSGLFLWRELCLTKKHPNFWLLYQKMLIFCRFCVKIVIRFGVIKMITKEEYVGDLSKFNVEQLKITRPKIYDKALMQRAKKYTEKLANGVNPFDDTDIPEDDIVNNERISKCLLYVSDILRQLIEDGKVTDNIYRREKRKRKRKKYSR